MRRSGKIRKIAVSLMLIPLLCVLLTFGAFAEDGSIDLPEEYYGIVENLPPESADKLPQGLYSEDMEEIGDALLEISSAEYIFDFIGELIGNGIGDALSLAARLCGIIVLSAVFSALRRNLSEAASGAIGFCVFCAVFAAIIDLVYGQIKMVSDFFDRINSLIVSVIPVTGAVYAMGGNVSTAVASSGGMYAFLAVSEGICAKTVIPVSCICIALALCRGVAPHINLQGIASGMKKCYTFVLGMIMTILLAILSTQTSLTAAADTTAARAAKMVASSAIPVVGGSVAETLRTIASGVQYTKSVVGVSGIVVILMLLLPTLISLLLTRLALIFAGSVAELLGCEGESRLIRELDSVWGFMIAVVAMCSVMFIFAMTIFIKTTVAIL